jgi:hypothetical protein
MRLPAIALARVGRRATLRHPVSLPVRRRPGAAVLVDLRSGTTSVSERRWRHACLRAGSFGGTGQATDMSGSRGLSMAMPAGTLG